MSIEAFLRARLDEDEAAAKAAWQHVWVVIGNSVSTPGRPGVPPLPVADTMDAETAEHIARHDPARVLREVEAKRKILALHAPDRNPADQWYGHDVRCEECGYIGGSAAGGERGVQRSWPCHTLRLLAAAYSSHPDYRQEWA